MPLTEMRVEDARLFLGCTAGLKHGLSKQLRWSMSLSLAPARSTPQPNNEYVLA